MKVLMVDYFFDVTYLLQSSKATAESASGVNEIKRR
jgi:hypothetical protein